MNILYHAIPRYIFIRVPTVYGMETTAMTETQQEKVKCCENTCVRRFAGVKKWKSEELREEVGVKENFRRKLMKSGLKWAGHVERMVGESLTKRANALRVERFVARQLQHFLIENSIYAIYQSAYRPRHSAKATLLRIHNNVAQPVEARRDVLLVRWTHLTIFNIVL